MKTPWGQSDYIDTVAEGITFHSTPSHGGYCLTPERNAQVKPEYRAFAAKWSKGWYDGGTDQQGWYEEDCAALAVAVTFPECFPQVTKSDLEGFELMLEEWVSND